jgi:hypothetical protein
MSEQPDHPFDTIESAQEFMTLLEQSIEEALQDVRNDLEAAQGGDEARRIEALNLALYKMEKLSCHVQKSRRILNDLRTLRRLLFAERLQSDIVNQ